MTMYCMTQKYVGALQIIKFVVHGRNGICFQLRILSAIQWNFLFCKNITIVDAWLEKRQKLSQNPDFSSLSNLKIFF